MPKEETYVRRIERELRLLKALFKRNKTLAAIIVLAGIVVVIFQAGYLKPSQPSKPDTLAAKVLEQASAYKELVDKHNTLREQMAISETENQKEKIEKLEKELKNAKSELNRKVDNLELVIDPKSYGGVRQAPSSVVDAWEACVQQSGKGGASGCDALLQQGIFSVTKQ